MLVVSLYARMIVDQRRTVTSVTVTMPHRPNGKESEDVEPSTSSTEEQPRKQHEQPALPCEQRGADLLMSLAETAAQHAPAIKDDHVVENDNIDTKSTKPQYSSSRFNPITPSPNSINANKSSVSVASTPAVDSSQTEEEKAAATQNKVVREIHTDDDKHKLHSPPIKKGRNASKHYVRLPEQEEAEEDVANNSSSTKRSLPASFSGKRHCKHARVSMDPAETREEVVSSNHQRDVEKTSTSASPDVTKPVISPSNSNEGQRGIESKGKQKHTSATENCEGKESCYPPAPAPHSHPYAHYPHAGQGMIPQIPHPHHPYPPPPHHFHHPYPHPAPHMMYPPPHAYYPHSPYYRPPPPPPPPPHVVPPGPPSHPHAAVYSPHHMHYMPAQPSRPGQLPPKKPEQPKSDASPSQKQSADSVPSSAVPLKPLIEQSSIKAASDKQQNQYSEQDGMQESEQAREWKSSSGGLPSSNRCVPRRNHCPPSDWG